MHFETQKCIPRTGLWIQSWQQEKRRKSMAFAYIASSITLHKKEKKKIHEIDNLGRGRKLRSGEKKPKPFPSTLSLLLKI